MKIQILPLVTGAQKATGLTVIIDVFRAFSLEAYMYASGAKKVIRISAEEKESILYPCWGKKRY